MAIRTERLAEFITDRDPPEAVPLRLLCEDHNGTYVLNFACVRDSDGWKNSQTGEAIVAAVVGWDFWTEPRHRRRIQ